MNAFDNPQEFVERMKEFASKKRRELTEMADTLSKHPENPKIVREGVLGVLKLSETLERLNRIFDEEDEIALLLLPESPEKKSSNLQPHGGREGGLLSSHSLRQKLQSFIAKEYEQLLKYVTKLKEKRRSASPHSQEPSQNQILIEYILDEIEKIEMNLVVFEGAVSELEVLVQRSDKLAEIRKRIYGVNSLKNEIYCNYKDHVVRQIQENREMTQYINQNSSLTIEERRHKQLNVESPSKKLDISPKPGPSGVGDASPKAGPSTVSQSNINEASTPSGTPKRTKKRSVFSKKQRSNDED